MRSFILPTALLLLAPAPAKATDALFFNGGGYCIEVLVGYDNCPVVAQVIFTPPGLYNWAALSGADLHIEKFDTDKQFLVLQFTNTGDPELPQSFNLAIKKSRGTLVINGKRIKGNFDWTM